MPETSTPAPAPVVQEPTKIPPPVAAGSQGAAALVDEPKKKEADDPYEFDVESKGQKQKLKFQTKEQLRAVIQKALYSDQMIKEGVQAKKATEALMQKLKTPQGLREILADPEIGVDFKKLAIEEVRAMMEDEKLTEDQRSVREWKSKAEKLEAEKKERDDAFAAQEKQKKINQQAQEVRKEIIDAMKAYPDIPQTQATMDAMIQNMRAAFKRFGKHLTPSQAMAVYSQQYWNSLSKVIETLPAEKMMEKFGQKTIDKLQQFKLQELKKKTDPSNLPKTENGEVKKKKHLTEKEFDRHFKQLAGGL